MGAPVEVVGVLVVGVLAVVFLPICLPVFIVAGGGVDLGLVVAGAGADLGLGLVVPGALAGGEGLLVLNEDV